MNTYKKPYPIAYIIVAILFTIFTFVYLTLCNVVYINGHQIYLHGVTEMEACYTIRSATASMSNSMQQVRIMGEQMRRMIDDEDPAQKAQEATELVQKTSERINSNITTMNEAIGRCRAIPNLTAEESANIEQMAAAVDQVTNVSLTIIDSARKGGKLQEDLVEQMGNAQQTVFASLEKTMASCRVDTAADIEKSRKFHIVTNFMMMFIYIIGLPAILIVGNIVRKKEETIFIKEEEASYQQSKAEQATKKTVDIAYTNLVMDCGNQYALMNYLDEVLKSNKNIYVGKLEIADFDSILSMVGYGQMDNYMSVMASRIRSAYDESGTLFTVSGKEFVFAFNPGVTEHQASTSLDDCKRIISNFTSVLNIQIGSPILSALAYTGNFKTKTGDAMLTALHTDCLKSKNLNPSVIL